jgi:hypothetical protein
VAPARGGQPPADVQSVRRISCGASAKMVDSLGTLIRPPPADTFSRREKVRTLSPGSGGNPTTGGVGPKGG